MFVCGSDEHGVPITIKAKQEGVTPQDIVDRYHKINKKAFADFGIEFDIYSRTTSETHAKTASDFFRTLYDKGKFIEKTTQQYFDEEAQQFLADRYIIGTCVITSYSIHYTKLYEPLEAASPAATSGTLLVVDDNEMNRDMLSRRLTRRGFDA